MAAVASSHLIVFFYGTFFFYSVFTVTFLINPTFYESLLSISIYLKKKADPKFITLGYILNFVFLHEQIVVVVLSINQRVWEKSFLRFMLKMKKILALR